MADFKIYESPTFLADMEEALTWLYFHNLEQSEEFAEKKFSELEDEVGSLKKNLLQTPYFGQADTISGIRRFPVYAGRFFCNVGRKQKYLYCYAAGVYRH